MKNLNKYKAAMSRKKVQSNPLEEIMRPPEAVEIGPGIYGLPPEAADSVSRGDADAVEAVAAATSPVGALSPIDVKIVAAGRRLVQVMKARHGVEWGPPLELEADIERFAVELAAAPKRPQNSPAVRDERMRRKGRFPGGTKITIQPYDAENEEWVVTADVPNVTPFFHKSGPGIHGCIESLWDQYCRWRDEQTEAAK